uniref:Uncharacterized protein n=1 Tax=Oryza glumipatula TaxID=40148 RepID=A0A0D9ZAV1_9ORYZ
MKSADRGASVRCGGCCMLPFSVVHQAGSGYVFWLRNLLGALSRMSNGGILGCRDHRGGIVFGASSLWCCRRPSGVRPCLAGVIWC